MEQIAGVDAARVFEIVALLDEHHPHGSFYYLQFLGVEPACQGQGIGSTLMASVLNRCDRQGLPAYLEATSPRNRRLYERHGFEATGKLAPASGPPLWPFGAGRLHGDDLVSRHRQRNGERSVTRRA